MSYSDLFPKIVSHAKEHGFIFQSSEIYDGLSAVYDYGPLGAALKRNIVSAWLRFMAEMREEVVAIDAAILMAPRVWKASGHVDAFNDPMIDNKDSKKRYRADALIEDYIEAQRQKSLKDANKKAKKEGWELNGPEYNDYLRKSRYGKKAAEIKQRLEATLASDDLQGLRDLIVEYEIADPESGSKEWTDVRQFNLMFSTQSSAADPDAGALYLRPETAQGIFVNFLNVQKTTRLKPPFGVAQTGKAFRNEIIARQFIFRMREFEQMEMQYFVPPGAQKEWYDYWLAQRLGWHKALGLTPGRLRLHEHEKLAHYADAAVDIEFEFPFGFKELEGIHSRTDFDLRMHEEYSGKKLRYFDPETRESYIPYVVETSAGLDRTFLTHLCDSYAEEEAPTASGGTETRTVLKLHPLLAPAQVAILPLVKKDGLPEIARRIQDDLKYDFACAYDEKDAVGRRYRRQDAKGAPFCITIDQETQSEDTVTVRDRDTMQQERVAAGSLRDYFKERFSFRGTFEGI